MKKSKIEYTIDAYSGNCLITVYQDFSFISGLKIPLASNVNLNGTNGKFTLGTSQTAAITENNPLGMDKVLLTNDINFSIEDLQELYKEDIGKISDTRLGDSAELNLPLSADLSNNGTGTGISLAGTKVVGATSEVASELEYESGAVKLNGQGNYIKVDDDFRLGTESFTLSFNIKISELIGKNKQLILFSTTNGDNFLKANEAIGGLNVSLQSSDAEDYTYKFRYKLNNITLTSGTWSRANLGTDWHNLTFSFMRNNGRLVIMSYIDFVAVDVINVALPDDVTLDSQQPGISNFRIGSHYVTPACPVTWGSVVDFYLKDFIFSRQGDALYNSTTLKEYYAVQTYGQEYFFIGDSYTTLSFWSNYKTEFNDDGADNALKYNIGVGGTKVDYWRERLYEIKTLREGNINLRYTPRSIVIHIGVNDINGGMTGDYTLANLRAMLEEYQAAFPYTDIYFITIEPNSRADSATHAQYNIVNEGIIADANTNEKLHVIDTRELAGAQYYKDGLHLNEAGYEIWTAKIKQALGLTTTP